MKILSSSEEISRELERLMDQYSVYKWAVAWASPSDKDLNALHVKEACIDKFVIGIHFYQTNPKFILKFKDNSKVRYIFHPNGVYHPKIYLFENPNGQWECLTGSPNFTYFALNRNLESAVLIGHSDFDADEAHKKLSETIEEYWNKSKQLNDEEIEKYITMRESKQKHIRQLTGEKYPSEANNKSPLDRDICTLTWQDYFKKVKDGEAKAPTPHTLEQRIKVLDFANEKLKNNSFIDLSKDDRKKIAGLITEENIDWKYFGSMSGNGTFYKKVNENNQYISKALDKIPMLGEVQEENYNSFIIILRKAFPDGGVAIATASRLLAMKRPDYFVCIDGKNKKGLCKAFEVSTNVTFENYWNNIIEVIKSSIWWDASEPQSSELEKSVWKYRAAFLDSIYFKP